MYIIIFTELKVVRLGQHLPSSTLQFQGRKFEYLQKLEENSDVGFSLCLRLETEPIHCPLESFKSDKSDARSIADR